MSHDEASDLLGAYALDAVDTDESVELEEHLAGCPRCRAELDSMREVAGALGNSVEPLPDGLWSSIANRLPERERDEPPPMPSFGSEAGTPFRTPTDTRRRRRRGAVTTAVALAVAAAAVAVVLGISLVRADNTVSDLRAAARPPGAVAAALRAPGHHVVALRDSSHAQLAEFVVIPNGQGYLVSSSLPRLGSSRTYQLWGIVGERTISLGLLGSSPQQASFTMAGVVRPSVLAVTAEPAGGSLAPSSSIVASGTV
jgi:anti-sigma factor RsiW